MSDQQQIDPSIYQYDEVYEEIKNTKKSVQQQKQTNNQSINKQRQKQKQQRDRSRQKQQIQTSGSRYIKKMKQIVAERQVAHQRANASKLERENQRLGISKEQVFVTESYLQKKRQEKQRERKQKQRQKYDEEHSILNKKKNVHEFTRRLLDNQVKHREKK